MSQLKAYRLQTLVFLAVLLSAASLTKASMTLDEKSVQKLSGIAVDLSLETPALPQALEEEKLEEELENKENALPFEDKVQGGKTEKLEEELENKENALPFEDKVQGGETEKLEEEVENKEHALPNEDKVKEEEVGGGKLEEELKENTADRQYYDQWQYQQSHDYQWQYQQSQDYHYQHYQQSHDYYSYDNYGYYGREAELVPSRTYDEAVKARNAGLLSSVLYTIGDVFNPRPTYYSYNRPSSYYYPSSNYYYNRPNSYYSSSSYAPYRRIRFAARRPASAPGVRAIGGVDRRPNPVRPRLRQRQNLAGPRRQRLSPARSGKRHLRPIRRRYVPHLVMSTTK